MSTSDLTFTLPAVLSLGLLHPITLFTLLFSLALTAYYTFKKPNLDLPVITPGPGPQGVFQTLKETYEKYPDTPFILNTSRPIVILPGELINDVKNLPEDKVSLHSEVAIDHSMAVTKVGGGTYGSELLPTVRVDLTRHTNGAIPAILEELRFAMDVKFRDVDSKTWSTQVLFPKITELSALTLSRIFIGRPISRKPEWLGSAIGYTHDLMRARHALNKYPYWLRLIIGRFLPEVRQMNWHLENGRKILLPIVDDLVRKAGALDQPTEQKANMTQQQMLEDKEAPEFDDEQGTFCSWLLKYQLTPSNATASDIARSLALNQLALSWVSIHSVTFAVMRAIYDLTTRPEYFEPLRQEIEEVLAIDGFQTDRQGRRIMERTSYVKLRKLDSFLKESMRLCPNKIVNMARIVKEPTTLSTGHILPAGTRIGIPVYCIHTSSTRHQSYVNCPDVAPADTFDGFRFSKLREQAGNENKYQYVTITNDYLAWGAGTHACPGRFFSSTCIKVLFVELLRFWDFRLVGDEDAKGGSPVGYRIMDFTMTTDVTVPLQIRRRESAT